MISRIVLHLKQLIQKYEQKLAYCPWCKEDNYIGISQLIPCVIKEVQHRKFAKFLENIREPPQYHGIYKPTKNIYI